MLHSTTACLPQVLPIRQASREMVRELGLLDGGRSHPGVSHSQAHMLIEIDRSGTLSAGELAAILKVDKANVSRGLAALIDKGLVRSRMNAQDKRQKVLALTPKGQRKLDVVHGLSNAQVHNALSLLEPHERETVVAGLEHYAKALARSRQQSTFEIRPITRQDDADVARIIRAVMTEFGATAPGFAIHDAEVSAMSATYAKPDSGFFVITRAGRVVGGAGFGPLQGGDPHVCELRKMYFLPEARGCGMGKKLLHHVLQAATAAGYRQCYLETVERLQQARTLYESMGFVRVNAPLGNTGHFVCDYWYVLHLNSMQISRYEPQRDSQPVIDLILHIQQKEFGVPVTLNDQPDLIDVPATYFKGVGNFWVMRDGDKLIGTIAMIDIGNGQVAVRKMFVAKAYRGKTTGVAKTLLEHLLAACRHSGVREVYLGTTDVLKAAHRFYEKNNFTEIAKGTLPKAFPIMQIDTKFYRRNA